MSCAYAFRGFDVRKSLILREPHAQKAEKLSKSGAANSLPRIEGHWP